MIYTDVIFLPLEGTSLADPMWDHNKSCLRHVGDTKAEDWKLRVDISGRLYAWKAPAPHTCHRGRFHECKPQGFAPESQGEEKSPEKLPEVGAGVKKLLMAIGGRTINRTLAYTIEPIDTEYKITTVGRQRLRCTGAILNQFDKRQVAMITPTVATPTGKFWAVMTDAFVLAMNRLTEWLKNRIKAAIRDVMPTVSQPRIDELTEKKLLSMGWSYEHQKNGMVHAHLACIQRLSPNGPLLYRWQELEEVWNRQYLAELHRLSPEAAAWLKASKKQTNCHVATAKKDVMNYVMKYASKGGNIPAGTPRLKQYWGVSDAVRWLMAEGEQKAHFSLPKQGAAILVEALLSTGVMSMPFSVRSADGVLRCITSLTTTRNLGWLMEYLSFLLPSFIWSTTPRPEVLALGLTPP